MVLFYFRTEYNKLDTKKGRAADMDWVVSSILNEMTSQQQVFIREAFIKKKKKL